MYRFTALDPPMTDRLRYRLTLLLLALAVGGLFIASLLVGPAHLAPLPSLRALILGDGGPVTLILREIRLPRAALGLLIGAGLGLSGAALQGYLRNPLAEPGLLGVSGSAALGAVLALYTGIAAVFPLALPLAALAGAFAAAALVQGMAGSGASSITLILAGIAVSSLAGALTALVLNLAPNPFAASEIVHWLMGSLADRSLPHLWLAAPFILAGGGLLLALGPALDALTLGEEAAASLGVSLDQTRALTLAGVTLAVGAGVAVAGAIGFVGLVVPHLLRPLVGARPSALLVPSALGGAALVLGADTLCRLVPGAGEVRLGVAMALIGAPFFLALLLGERGRSWG